MVAKLSTIRRKLEMEKNWDFQKELEPLIKDYCLVKQKTKKNVKK